MSNADINTAISNQFLRILYTIIIPGIIPASVIVIYTGFLFDDNVYKSLGIEEKYILIAILVVATLIIGYLIEIFGVWLEARYIDGIISSQKKYEDFDSVWEAYLKIDTESTKNIILVQYYRTILTKFKFLINLAVSLWTVFLIIGFAELTIWKFGVGGPLKHGCCFLLFYLLLILVGSYFLLKRSLYCAIILHDSRKKILEISVTRVNNN